MRNDFPIVWVEIGRGVPRYLKSSIQLHSELFPNLRKILVSDMTPKNLGALDFEFVHLNDLVDVSYQIELFSQNWPKRAAQQSFWTHTTSRFFALQGLLKSGVADALVHLESDCILFSTVPIEKLFTAPDWNLAFPMQAENIGCASILLAQGRDAFDDFIECVQANLGYPEQDDMKLLGNFKRQGSTQILESAPGPEWIFDAQTFGRYLFGADARNSRWPFSTRGIIDNRTGSLNPSEFSFGVDLDGEIPKIFVDKGGLVSSLANVHLHSKRMPKSLSGLRRMIRCEIPPSNTKLWQVGRLDTTVFAERLVSFVAGKVFGKKWDFRLR